MSLLSFLKEYYELRRESKSYCKSCETLREQLSVANFQNKQLMDKLFFPVTKPPAVITEAPQPILPKVVPWKVQREMLVAEDRQKARIMREQELEIQKASQAVKKDTSKPIEEGAISVEQLEKELNIGEENAI